MDVNDLIANTLGGMVGYLVIRAASRVSATAGIARAFALHGEQISAGRTLAVEVR
ncbi:hypothetical protein AB0L99_07190 [Streptomyces sp. NPDC051954]|uniref:hypothetical protein n=1 Tax=Streptomyces sp. NPDC051954 TaxID=3155524 RepID=UPI00341FA5D0